jgi:hypothetical protein
LFCNGNDFAVGMVSVHADKTFLSELIFKRNLLEMLIRDRRRKRKEDEEEKKEMKKNKKTYLYGRILCFFNETG